MIWCINYECRRHNVDSGHNCTDWWGVLSVNCGFIPNPQATEPQDPVGSALTIGSGTKPTVEEMLKVIAERRPEIHRKTVELLKQLEAAYEATKESKLHFP